MGEKNSSGNLTKVERKTNPESAMILRRSQTLTQCGIGKTHELTRANQTKAGKAHRPYLPSTSETIGML